MKICALDTETTGLNVEKDRVTEWGIVLYDVAARQPEAYESERYKK